MHSRPASVWINDYGTLPRIVAVRRVQAIRGRPGENGANAIEHYTQVKMIYSSLVPGRKVYVRTLLQLTRPEFTDFRSVCPLAGLAAPVVPHASSLGSTPPAAPMITEELLLAYGALGCCDSRRRSMP